jgi:hypothetical protein
MKTSVNKGRTYLLGVWLCLGAGLLMGCDEDPKIRFGQAQPEDVKPMDAFGKALQGRWMSMVDSSVLVINANAVVRQDRPFGKVAIKELKEGLKITIKAQKAYQEDSIEVGRVVGDSVVLKASTIDTLFVIGAGHILKEEKGQWFLNDERQAGYLVRRLQLVNGKELSYDRLTHDEDRQILKSVTSVSDAYEEDSAQVMVAMPSKREFRRFLRQDGFANRERFVRLK